MSFVFHNGTPAKADRTIWNTSTWRDKAGGYGIQEPFGAIAVKSIDGDYYNIMGLPVGRLYQILKNEFGMEL